MDWVAVAGGQPCGGEYGWCPPPEAAPRGSGAALHHAAHLPAERPAQECELAGLAAYALRVLLGSDGVLLHSQLRVAVLGRGEAADGASRSKRLLELAVAWLLERGLVARQGHGHCAALVVPHTALPQAEALAFAEFPDESQLPAAQLGGGTRVGHRASSCLGRGLRRHTSPRQFGARMSGIEKATARRGKRGSMGDELGSQLAKKMRVGEGAAAVGAPFSPGGCIAMSP